jgi:hypothetical protein
LLEIEQLTQRDRLDLIELELAERPPRMRLWIASSSVTSMP